MDIFFYMWYTDCMKDFDIEEELNKLPQLPGVYLMHSDSEEILYVGKAIDLHKSVAF